MSMQSILFCNGWLMMCMCIASIDFPCGDTQSTMGNLWWCVCVCKHTHRDKQGKKSRILSSSWEGGGPDWGLGFAIWIWIKWILINVLESASNREGTTHNNNNNKKKKKSAGPPFWRTDLQNCHSIHRSDGLEIMMTFSLQHPYTQHRKIKNTTISITAIQINHDCWAAFSNLLWNVKKWWFGNIVEIFIATPIATTSENRKHIKIKKLCTNQSWMQIEKSNTDVEEC